MDKRVIERDIIKEMEKSFLDYSMSVIVSRALPDVRDGLKPVHRRIIYSMYEQGFTNDKAFKKSARIVGDVIGKYHPHGESAIYNAMVRLAQDFSTRCLLVDGQGNFGSIDGDSAAAMRYTEAKMSKLSNELIKDLEKETVDFYPNFDETLKQPTVLPSRFPNLLINGSTGIAVGMTTSIPPHNLGEVIDACVHIIENPEAEIKELLNFIKGPDFPTGASIIGKEGIRRAYLTGHGRARIRAKAEIEESSGRHKIVVSEIPYMLNKSKLLTDIANLVKTKKIDGITELRDESNRLGIRVVMEIRRDANANVILNQLYKMTSLQTFFSMIFIALDKGMPRTFNLKEMLEKYIEHQIDVETRRINFDLRKARERAHILEGYLIALQNIDEVIKVIRSSYDDARERLIDRFNFTIIQANSILSMQLRRLQGLEYEKIENELKELHKKIEEFLELLSNKPLLMNFIKEHLIEIKEKYSDKRRTVIEENYEEIDFEDLIDEKEMLITLTRRGYIKRVYQDEYSSQHRGGRGITGLSTRDEDVVSDLFTASTHSDLLCFTNIGRLHRIKAYQIPESGRTAKGTPVINLIPLEEGEIITSIIPVNEIDERQVVMVTKKGIVNKILLQSLISNRRSGIKVIRLDDKDYVINVRVIEGDEDIFITTRKGKSIRFKADSLSPRGRNTRGVIGIRLSSKDKVVSMNIIDDEQTIFTCTENGFGKKTSSEAYRAQTRGGKGVFNYKTNKKTGKVISSLCIEENDEVFLINTNGTVIRIRMNDVPTVGRHTSGVNVMRMAENIKIVSAAKVIEIEDEEEVDGD